MCLSQHHIRDYVDLLHSFTLTRFRNITTSRFAITIFRRLPGMTDDLSHERLFADPKRLLLDMAREQSLAELLHLTGPFPDWVAAPDWVRAEGIRGFAGQPLVHRGKVLGVLALFARGAIGADCMGWLRMIADHAAASIVTGRAFAEIEALKKRLELENEYLREEVMRAGAFGELLGQSPALEAVARQIDVVAPTDSAVLILGESGTGKELVPREIH